LSSKKTFGFFLTKQSASSQNQRVLKELKEPKKTPFFFKEQDSAPKKT